MAENPPSHTLSPDLIIAQAKRHFRCFLTLVWNHLGLPVPTRVQLEIADYLQHCGDAGIVHAQRGEGKSWITAAYVLWRLWLDPEINVLVVSASGSKAYEFSSFCKRLISEMPLLQHMKPTPEQRDAIQAWDVRGAGISQAPSVKSIGITGQITGARADLIVADDIETISNSLTVEQREKLLYLVTEFTSVLKPGGQIRFLGTPQSVESIYKTLAKRGYIPRFWTSRIPAENEMEIYGDYLAPSILKRIQRGEPPGTPTDPQRFSDEILKNKELQMGRSNYMLQFQLNTSLSDLNRYPLRTSDLIVMPLNAQVAPVQLQHAAIRETKIREITGIGFSGDAWYKPFYRSEDFVPYMGSVMAIDPSGKGNDESAYAIVKQLHGNLFLLDAGGMNGGYDGETLVALANKAKQFGVNKVITEANFGDGMFTQLLTPVLAQIHPCEIEEVKHSKQKELRIIDTLEPLMNSHRLIVDQSLVEREINAITQSETEASQSKNLFYQMTRITKDKGSLKHDDRLDALAMACAYWVEAVAQDSDRRAKELEELKIQKTLDEFMEHIYNGTAMALGNFSQAVKTFF